MSTTTGVAARDRPIAAGQLPTKVAGRSYEPDMRPAVRPPRCGLRPTMSPPADLTEASCWVAARCRLTPKPKNVG